MVGRGDRGCRCGLRLLARAFPAFAAAAAAATLLNAAGPQPLATNDLYTLRAVSDVQLTRDGSRVAYTVQNSDRPGRPYSQVWIANVTKGTSPSPALVADGASPRWSPDSSRLAYIGPGAELYVAGVKDKRPDGGTRVEHNGQAATGQVKLADVLGTNHPLPSTGEEIAWSPDGKQIAFVSATPAEPSGDDPLVITRYLYKPPASSDRQRFNDNRRLHIFVADVATGTLRQLTHGDRYEHSIDWSPDGREILFVSNLEPDPDRVFNYDIFAVRVGDGAIRRLTRTRSAEYEPRWSEDGRQIAFLATTRELTSSETTMEDTHAWVMNADGGGRREIGATIDNRQEAPQWAGGVPGFTVQERGVTRLYIDGHPVEAGGSVVAWSATGDRIAAAVATANRPPALVTCGRPIGPCQTLADLNAFLRERAIAPAESFTFKSFDGREVEAFLTRPTGWKPGGKYPLVVTIHGGPHGQQGPAFNSKAQIYAGAGFGSLMVNYRGSTGYGQKFADAISGDQNGGEAKDVLGGLSAAIAKYPWIDRHALFVEGMSYGGQLTNWIVTQTDRFRAAVASAGISNLVSFNYMAYYHDYLAVEFGSYPHQRGLIDRLWERSPIRYAKDVRTPVMFLHGENDNDVPIAEAEQFYIALKDVGVETVMVRYPREGHGLRETRHVADAIDRSLDWYRRHLSAGRQDADKQAR
jgi:dipeptidyl aminopeptidase/acylaminoacyl peptidase